MALPKKSVLLRIFIGEEDRYRNRSLAEVIVERAKTGGLAGATVFHGAMGFGAGSRIHTAKILRLSEDLPVLIEIVDSGPKIKAFLRVLGPLMQGGLVTQQTVQARIFLPRRRHRD